MNEDQNPTTQGEQPNTPALLGDTPPQPSQQRVIQHSVSPQHLKPGRFKKHISPKVFVLLVLGIFIGIPLIYYVILSNGDKHRLYFSSLSPPDGFSVKVYFNNGGFIDCLDVCDSSSFSLKTNETMTIDNFTDEIQKMFGDRFILDSSVSQGLSGFSLVTPEYQYYCGIAETVFISSESRMYDYTKSEDCPFNENVWTVRAEWLFTNKSTVLDSIFLPLPKCKSIHGELRSLAYPTKEMNHKALEANFECSTAASTWSGYEADKQSKSCGKTKLCIEQ